LPLIAESAGRLKILLQEGETAGIGDVACLIDTDAKQPKITSSPTSSEVIVKSEEPSERATITDVASSASVSYAAGHPSPAAKKMMAEKGATGVSGSGPRWSNNDSRRRNAFAAESGLCRFHHGNKT